MRDRAEHRVWADQGSTTHAFSSASSVYVSPARQHCTAALLLALVAAQASRPDEPVWNGHKQPCNCRGESFGEGTGQTSAPLYLPPNFDRLTGTREGGTTAKAVTTANLMVSISLRQPLLEVRM